VAVATQVALGAMLDEHPVSTIDVGVPGVTVVVASTDVIPAEAAVTVYGDALAVIE